MRRSLSRNPPPALLAALAALAAIAAACPHQAAADPPLSYAAAYTAVNRTHGPLLVFVISRSCGPCQQMKPLLLAEALKPAGAFAGHSLAIVEYEAELAIAGQLLEGNAVPCLVLFRWRQNQWWRRRLTGFHSLSDVTAFLNGEKRE